MTRKATGEQPTFIYALLDPFTLEVRYVGQSIRPSQRLDNHCHDPSVTWRTNWIREVLARGGRPLLEILEEVPPDGDWRGAERRWIAYGRDQDWPLTNCTDGGDGVRGLPAEIRERMAQPWRGRKHRPETLVKIGAASRGRHHTEAHKARMSEHFRGREFDADWRERIRQGVQKLTDAQVREVRGLLAAGARLKDVAVQYGVHRDTISNIKHGRFYQHVV